MTVSPTAVVAVVVVLAQLRALDAAGEEGVPHRRRRQIGARRHGMKAAGAGHERSGTS